MKMIFFKTFLLTIPLLMSLKSQAHETLSRVQGFELVTCNQEKKCIKLNSKKASSGTLSPIMTIRDFSLEIINKNGRKKIQGPFGYYDAQENKINLTNAAGTEIEINLKDLSEKEY